jgi:hypothetical protein
MNHRHQCSWMSRPSCFYPLLFFRSFPSYFIHESWFIHLSPAHLHPFMSRPSYFIPSFFWGLARQISSAFFVCSCPSYVIRIFLGSSCLSYFIHESWFIHLFAAHCTHSCLVRHIFIRFVFRGSLVRHISSTKVCSFICPPLLGAPGTHLRVRVCVRVASCAYSDCRRCRRIRVFSSGSPPSKKLLICALSCCFSLEDVVKLSA